MKRGVKRVGLMVLLASAMAACLAMADDPAGQLYSKAQKSLDREAYREAVEMFHRVASEYPESKQAGNALYFAALALYRLGDTESLREAHDTLARQKKRYPEASKSGDAASLDVRIDKELAENGDEEAARRMEERAREMAEEDRDSRATASSGDDQGKIELKLEALNALLQLDPDRAIPILKRLMTIRDKPSVELRRRAVFIVSQMDSEESLSILKDAIENDPDAEVREQSVFWLSQIGGEASLDIIIGILRSPGRSELKEKAIFALSQHDSPRAAAALKSAVLDASLPESVREQAIFWLGQADSPGTVGFLRELYGKVSSPALKEKIIFSVSQIGSSEGKTWMLGVVRDEAEDIEMRKKALFWAGQQGLLTRLELDNLWKETRDPELKDQIIFVLSQQGDAAAIDKLIEIARTEKNVELRKKAVFWLGQSDDPRALEYLERLINE